MVVLDEREHDEKHGSGYVILIFGVHTHDNVHVVGL